ncbi:MAG: type 1 glutamine amidotransferase domain-containing protein [Desulfobacterales bacterium]|nr:type 1 glutamine amidotransferase domain-containing protein [Desulfobacterales bacterium]
MLRRFMYTSLVLLAGLFLGASASLAGGSGKILIVVTSHAEALKGKVTGLWLSELTEPYWVFRDAGFEVEIASIKGGPAPIDPRSGSAASVGPAFRNDPAAMAAFNQATPVDRIKIGEYAALFLSGGHGTMWDFPSHPVLMRIVGEAFRAGKPVGGVCHGPAGFIGAVDAQGDPIVKGRRVTGFTNAEERAAGWTEYVPFLLEDRLKELGGRFENAGVFSAKAVRDGNLISGQNPASAAPAAKLVLEALGGN